jgi:hypothetical protein
MYRTVPDQQIENEAKAGYKPLTIESGITILPLSELGDREFELLSYLLIKQEIEEGGHPGLTGIALMQAVAERGRDCVLYRDNIVAGLVQCKKYASRLSRPQVLKELIKFLLFATLERSILPDPENFEYKLYVSNDLTGPAITLIHSYKSEIENELSSGNIAQYIDEVVAEYESFACYRGNPPVADVVALLKSIHVSACNATDLTNRIYKQQALLSSFFRVMTVVSLEAADTLIRTALDDYGLKLLTDEDLRALQDRIASVPADNRINLGWVDFFGFSKEFFRYLKGDKFKELMVAIASVAKVLGKQQIDFLNNEIRKSTQQRITLEFLYKGIVHPFSVSFAAPYLFERLINRVVVGSMPKAMLEKYYPQCAMTKDELIAKISQRLLDDSSRVMSGDYSQIVGDQDMVEFKLRLFEHMHQGLANINDAKTVLEKDLKAMIPVLDEIEKDISNKILPHRTVVIKDASFFDDELQLRRIASTIKDIDN